MNHINNADNTKEKGDDVTWRPFGCGSGGDGCEYSPMENNRTIEGELRPQFFRAYTARECACSTGTLYECAVVSYSECVLRERAAEGVASVGEG